MKRLLIPFFMFVATSVFGEVVTPCDPTVDKEHCTFEGAKAFYLAQMATPQAQLAAGKNAVATAQAKQENDVVTANRPTVAPPTFAARIHNSYEDFLNLFSFAINKVDESDNGQALIVRFNPLRQGSTLIGTTLTVTQPAVADVVKNAIPDGIRDKTVTALEKRIGSQNDLTFSASYSAATVRCGPDRPAGDRCWGRTPAAYRPLVSLLLEAFVQSNGASALLAKRLSDEYHEAGEDNKRIVGKADHPNEVIAIIKEEIAVDAARAKTAKAIYDANHLDLIATMIDNQPQATGTITVHHPALFGGPRSQAASVELHFGRVNMNTLRNACRDERTDIAIGSCFRTQLNEYATNGMSTDKLVFTASYDRAQHYSLASLGLDPPVEGFMAINNPQSDVLKVKAQGGRQLGTDITGKPLHADLSIEGGFNQKGNVRSNNRWVGTITLSVPFGDMMTIPVSITWANKAEFIGDVKNRIGAHVGLSYRLPDLTKLISSK